MKEKCLKTLLLPLLLITILSNTTIFADEIITVPDDVQVESVDENYVEDVFQDDDMNVNIDNNELNEEMYNEEFDFSIDDDEIIDNDLFEIVETDSVEDAIEEVSSETPSEENVEIEPVENFETILASSGSAGNVNWNYSDGVLLITGTGATNDYGKPEDVEWNSYSSSITKVIVGADITTLGKNVFSGLSNLTEMALPITLNKISDNVFTGDNKLSKITIPDAVTEISPTAFSNKNITICGNFGKYSETYASENKLHFQPIVPTSISDAVVTLPYDSTVATGSAITPEVTVVKGKTTLIKDIDYSVSYKNNISPGTATITVTGKEPYTSSVSKTFNIIGVSIASAQVNGIVNKNYNGVPQTQSFTVALNGKTLVAGTDFTVAYANNVNAGTATVTITGKGIYTQSLAKTFTISPISLSGAKMTGLKKKKAYTGSGVTQLPVVTLNNVTLIANRDYVITYKKNVKRGTATMIVTGKGNYKDSKTYKFKIVKAKIKKSNVSKIKSRVYTGKAIKPKVTIKVSGRKLKKGKDYKVSYSNNVNIGKATVIITGKGNYKGTAKVNIKIRKESIGDCSMTAIVDKEYTGKPIKQNIVLKTKNKTLQEDTDYTVKYKDNVNVGTATLTIKGRGNFKGKITETFKINKANMNKAKISGLKNMPYTGKSITQDPVVTISGNVMQKNKDYTLSFSNNINIGTATVTVTGKGNCTGQKTATFKIQQFPISNAQISGIEDKEYTGGEITQNFTVTYNGKKLKNGKDYSYRYTGNVGVGQASLIITGMGGYTGEIVKGFQILPQGLELRSAILSAGKLTVTWNGWPANVNGCQLQVSTSSIFDLIVMKRDIYDKYLSHYTMTPSDTSRPFYVRIRSIQQVNGQTYYSKWRSMNVSNS